MATTTANLGLTKPDYNETADIAVINNNMDVIDQTYGSLVDKFYPVGSIYMSVSSASPATLFGGTWERITGRFLLAATDGGSSGASQAAGRTGGAATVTLTVDQMPDHTHRFTNNNNTVSTPSVVANQLAGGSWGSSVAKYDGSAGGAGLAAAYCNHVGGGKAHENMPPYLAVYVWKRTA